MRSTDLGNSLLTGRVRVVAGQDPVAGVYRQRDARSRWAAWSVNRLVGLVDALTDMYVPCVLFAVVAKLIANGAGAEARVADLEAHAAAGRAAVGTEAISLLELAVCGFRAVGHPARTVALATEGRVGHASPTPSMSANPVLRKRGLQSMQ